MTREQLEHILRAAAGITGADQFVIVGSQSVLGDNSDPMSANGELHGALRASFPLQKTAHFPCLKHAIE